MNTHSHTQDIRQRTVFLRDKELIRPTNTLISTTGCTLNRRKRMQRRR
jgi:hypothetical protein